MQFLSDYTADEAANFYAGAALHDDVFAIVSKVRKNEAKKLPLILGGGNPLRQVFAILLRHAGVEDFTEVGDEEARLAPSLGAIQVYKAYREYGGTVAF